MKFKPSVFFLSIYFLVSASCNHGQKVPAFIFERKHISGNRLMIKYRYTVSAVAHTDSAIIPNTVLQSDTITIIVTPGNGAKKTTPRL